MWLAFLIKMIYVSYIHTYIHIKLSSFIQLVARLLSCGAPQPNGQGRRNGSSIDMKGRYLVMIRYMLITFVYWWCCFAQRRLSVWAPEALMCPFRDLYCSKVAQPLLFPSYLSRVHMCTCTKMEMLCYVMFFLHQRTVSSDLIVFSLSSLAVFCFCFFASFSKALVLFFRHESSWRHRSTHFSGTPLTTSSSSTSPVSVCTWCISKHTLSHLHLDNKIKQRKKGRFGVTCYIGNFSTHTVCEPLCFARAEGGQNAKGHLGISLPTDFFGAQRFWESLKRRQQKLDSPQTGEVGTDLISARREVLYHQILVHKKILLLFGELLLRIIIIITVMCHMRRWRRSWIVCPTIFADLFCFHVCGQIQF